MKTVAVWFDHSIN